MPRVLHVKDETGAPIERALIEACRREPNVQWKLQSTAVDLLTLSHDSTDVADRYHPPAVIGAHLLSRNSDAVTSHLARETILATGGLGQVYLHTTNPGARGDGFAMARRAGPPAQSPVRAVPSDGPRPSEGAPASLRKRCAAPAQRSRTPPAGRS